MRNDPECVKNFAIICAAEATGILPDELFIHTSCRKVAHARFLAMACMYKYSEMKQKQIAEAFGCVSRVSVGEGIKMVRDEIKMYNKYGYATELVKKYKICEGMMRKEFKPRCWANVPELEFHYK